MTVGLSKRDIAYDYLREQIVFCELKPGDFIDEKQITEQLGCSRTPVREAINKLVDENLVRIFPRKGIVVSEISLKDLEDMIESRLLIEPYLIHQAFTRLDHESLTAFRRQLEQKGSNTGATVDSVEDDFDYSFHMYFAKKSGNQFLISMMTTLLALSQRTRVFLPWSSERIVESVAEHLNIIDCVLNGDESGAITAVQQHLKHSHEGYLRVFQTHNAFLRG